MENIVEHVHNPLSDEGHGPVEGVVPLRQIVRRGGLIELPDPDRAILYQEVGTLVVIGAAVVGGGEDGDHGGELGG